MANLSKLTAKDFSDAMHKGWVGKKWCNIVFFQREGRPCDKRYATECCAIGAMSVALKKDAVTVAFAMENIKPLLKNEIVEANDAARNKRAAMKAVDAILLGATP